MANYIPKGWRMSQEGAARYRRERALVERVVRQKANRYSLPSMSREDLLQEGRLAAAYAVDTYRSERGAGLERYVSRVVGNALAMVAGEALARCRQPRAMVLQDGAWREIHAHFAELNPEDRAAPTDDGETRLLGREIASQIAADASRERAWLSSIPLSSDARQVCDLKLSPPGDLLVMARNTTGRYKVESGVLAAYLGWPKTRVARAQKEVEGVLRAELGH